MRERTRGVMLGSMSSPRNPRPIQPNDDPREHPNPAPERSLAEQLGGVVDDLRQLYTDVGLRPYRVHSIVLRWTGGAVGRGEAEVASEEELLPTPLLVNTDGLRVELRSGGSVERGDAQLRQISPRYTEDQVRQLFHCGMPMQPGYQGFIEVRVDARDGSTERRRYIITGVPYRSGDAFEWRARLLRQDSNRSRNGAPPNLPR